MTVAVRERPILFSGPMVRAILAGQKTQTRRVVKPQPPPECGIHFMLGNESWITDPGRRTPLRHTWEAWHGPLYHNRPEKYLCGVHTVVCPFGVPGDRIWVREAWLPDPPIDDTWASTQWENCGRSIEGVPADYRSPQYCVYREGWNGPDLTWRPSIHMPRWASRITLEITDVRVERLQDISLEDIYAEGVRNPVYSPGSIGSDFSVRNVMFPEGWDQLNAARGYSWQSNPWVWAITFKVVTA